MKRSQACRARAACIGVLVLSSGVCLADEKSQCLAAHESAQDFRRKSQLLAAREQLAACARSECPALVRNDCLGWMKDVLASMSSVVFAARDASGKDLIAVRVVIDGREVATQLDGHPVLVDPGVHEVQYESPGSPAIVERVVIREGEKNRPLTASFTKAPVEAARPRATSPAPWVLGAVSAASLGTALYFDLATTSRAAELRTTCAPVCEPQEVERLRTQYVVAAVLLGVGVALATGAIIAAVVGSSPASAKSAVRLSATPVAGGAVGVLAGQF